MLSVVLLGTGNVATHLFQAFSDAKGVEVVQVYGRDKEALQSFEKHAPITTSLKNIDAADVYMLAISDGAIVGVSRSLIDKKGLVVHTSGSVALDALETKRKGVFYPLQTFTKGKKVDFSELPICVEAKNEHDFLLLETLGNFITNQVHRVSSKQREKLHLSAVLVNNFPNHLYTIAKELCVENEIPFDMLLPLISETVDKIRFLSPKEAQTGPARRNNITTMQHHLEQLSNPIHKRIYQLISESIRESI
jgi:predicted short-subunit dehydrogenase-like oxidoreductase (DUF2520 family)